MARSSFGPNQASIWAVAQKPRPKPRVVRLGRPANDNHRRHGVLTRLFVFGLATTLLGFVLLGAWLV
ncbi:MAG: hypothetical protein Q8K93_17640 [Reyranella sp.]|uniref:hypothetical protein n=1 Tax=Reyranella sp. TaxID=1929291 RepID=UPI00273094B0|nr:hypothetical protein [Reyranella sp.]MDP1964014.1 hypothetical protein [Reyranella sp.]MDP2373150.1 hypothetical protein [Reyranella sp.]